MKIRLFLPLLASLLLPCSAVFAQDSLSAQIDKMAHEIESRMIEWRRDIHQNPELSNREFKTAGKVAAYLSGLGIEVKTGVAHTGVIGILRGMKDTPVVALRADMDALPVTELADVPFASKAKGVYNGQEVGVMHACGHDNHVAVLMAVAEILSKVKDQLPGTVKFIFQPAEEGVPEGEEGGADLMMKEGALENPKPDAIFALHVGNLTHDKLIYRSGPMMASADEFRLKITGRQSHGASPWEGIDPIVLASQIVLAYQTIVSRQIDITEFPAIVTVGSIHGGVRFNIVPESVELVGTIRTFDEDVKKMIHERMDSIASSIASSVGATAELKIKGFTPVTVNDKELTEWSIETLEEIMGKDYLEETPLITGAEDFAFFANEIPGFYFFLGVTEEGKDPKKIPGNHSPLFYVDESTLKTGLRAMTHLATQFLVEGGVKEMGRNE